MDIFGDQSSILQNKFKCSSFLYRGQFLLSVFCAIGFVRAFKILSTILKIDGLENFIFVQFRRCNTYYVNESVLLFPHFFIIACVFQDPRSGVLYNKESVVIDVLYHLYFSTCSRLLLNLSRRWLRLNESLKQAYCATMKLN